jgi:regulator of nonsense transcripts 2
MFGVSINHAVPSSLDPPENLIRIRLACTLLDTCGKFFTHADIKTKLPYFFVFFQVDIVFYFSLLFFMFHLLKIVFSFLVLFLV